MVYHLMIIVKGIDEVEDILLLIERSAKVDGPT